MIYILDTNVFREFFFHLPKKGKYFESVWNAFEQGIEKGTYISVDECYNELEGQFSKDAVALKWISERKKMFKNPDDAESKIMCKIFEKPKFQESIHSKNILDNRPSADAYEKLNTLSKQFQNQLGTQHPLYPYYQFTPSQEYEGNLVSSPLRDDARKKYPPRFVLNGIAKIGDDKINELSPEIIEYANRHQLSISLEIHSATKYLGEEKDPIQTEAESLIGATLIKEPRKFSEPRPYSIRIDNTPIFDYIELGVSEILEDKSVVVTNEKQQSPLINIRLVFNVYTHNIGVSMTAVDHSNETLLRYVTLMKAASEGKNISLYDLKNNTVFLSGPLRDCDYKSGFSNVDENDYYLDSNKSQLIGHWTFRHRSGH